MFPRSCLIQSITAEIERAVASSDTNDTDTESITEREAHRRAEADTGLCALPVGADYRPLGAVLRRWAVNQS